MFLLTVSVIIEQPSSQGAGIDWLSNDLLRNYIATINFIWLLISTQNKRPQDNFITFVLLGKLPTCSVTFSHQVTETAEVTERLQNQSIAELDRLVSLQQQAYDAQDNVAAQNISAQAAIEVLEGYNTSAYEVL